MDTFKLYLHHLSETETAEVYNTEMIRDFQPDERKPLSMIMESLARGEYAACGIFTESKVRVGYAFLVQIPSMQLLDYFAISPAYRGKGYGSAFLHLLSDTCKTDALLLETEDPDQIHEPSAERRLRFYLRNGCRDTGVRADLWGVPYRVLMLNGEIRGAASCYTQIYRHILPPHLFETRLRIHETETPRNPWEEIDLETYEQHMQLDSVMQLQTLNRIMRGQLSAYPVNTAMILGIAGGNGLEHIHTAKYKTVYGVDINAAYLRTVSERYPDLQGILHCIKADIVHEAHLLPQAELLIADLLIEYVGYSAFQKAVLQVSPAYVSCVIQMNTDETAWVSDSPFLHAFDRLDEVHHQMTETALTEAMAEIWFSCILRESVPLPNGKALVRMDFRKPDRTEKIQ